MNVNVNVSQNLTSVESELFGYLRDFVETRFPSTKVFAVGGWTRDKLLGVDSDDIDIMLSDVSGTTFANEFAKFLQQKYGLPAKPPHVIEADPLASKHLETAKMYIPLKNGESQEVDFVMARNEVYSSDSRIPQVTAATPEEDAFRRDLTINSIFYSINNNQVVDYTGNGIKDLVTGTIRTPMEPYKTFSDDPLRIFRVIRFAAKYNGKIDPETYKAMSDPSLRERIRSVISKERVGAEFTKMLKNPNSEVAIKILKETGLFNDIVQDAIKDSEYSGQIRELEMPQNNPHHKLNVWDHTYQVLINTLKQYSDAEPEVRMIMALSALGHDLGKLYTKIQAPSKSHPGSTSYHGHEDASKEIISLILKYLKFESSTISRVANIVGHHMYPHQLVGVNIKTLRKFIRKMGEDAVNWVDMINLATADALSKDVIPDSQIMTDYQALKSALQEASSSMQIQPEQQKVKPVLDGFEIMKLLSIKPGPIVKQILEFVKELMDENPAITKEEAAAQVQQRFGPEVNKKTASEGDSVSSENCPHIMLTKHATDICDNIRQGKYLAANTILLDLIKQYPTDENILRLASNSGFIVFLKDRNSRNKDISNFINSNVRNYTFDPVIASFGAGALILSDSINREDRLVREVQDIHPTHMSSVLLMIDHYRSGSNAKSE